MEARSDISYKTKVFELMCALWADFLTVSPSTGSQVPLTGCSSSLSATPDAMGAWSVAGSHM